MGGFHMSLPFMTAGEENQGVGAFGEQAGIRLEMLVDVTFIMPKHSALNTYGVSQLSAQFFAGSWKVHYKTPGTLHELL